MEEKYELLKKELNNKYELFERKTNERLNLLEKEVNKKLELDNFFEFSEKEWNYMIKKQIFNWNSGIKNEKFHSTALTEKEIKECINYFKENKQDFIINDKPLIFVPFEEIVKKILINLHFVRFVIDTTDTYEF